MPPTIPADEELFRFGQIAYDVAQIYGVTTSQGLARARRALNRAMISIAGHDRKWSWLKVKDSFDTVADTREYSLPQEVRGDLHQIWIGSDAPGVIQRVPTGQFVRSMPDPDSYSGNPYLFDFEGVDSSGCMVISLFPTPSSALEVFYRYTRHIRPISDEDKDVRQYWGLPQNMLETLITKAAAICVRGSSGERYDELNAEAEMQIAEAYAADQARLNTTFRARMIDESAGGQDVQLPVEYGLE